MKRLDGEGYEERKAIIKKKDQMDNPEKMWYKPGNSMGMKFPAMRVSVFLNHYLNECLFRSKPD